MGGPGSSVGITTAYELEGPGIESQWERDLQHLSIPVLRPTYPGYNGYRVFPGCKVRPGRDDVTSSPSSVEVKNRVELYLYSP
jgi:hypothetical protein